MPSLGNARYKCELTVRGESVPTAKPRRVMRGRWRRASPTGERLSAC